MEEWQLSEKDVVLVTDNASNMIVAAQVRKFPHLKCFAHTLNLASQRASGVHALQASGQGSTDINILLPQHYSEPHFASETEMSGPEKS